VRLLLDTHVVLWAITEPERLSAKAEKLIGDERNRLHVSAATIWEVAIKHAVGRGRHNDIPLSGTELLMEAEAAGIETLAVTPAHAAAVDRLARHHGDPFDRLLVAQAISEPMTLVTHDKALAAYGDHILLV
jgi:PIN domain nuclease of toxin-antitoxin system